MTHALWHFLQHEGVTFKKKPSQPPDRPDVARWRERRKARQATIDPRRPVFIDETWAKTNMTRTPWPMRQRRTPRRQNTLRPMADADVSGGVALRPADRALRHRRDRSMAQASALMSNRFSSRSLRRATLSSGTTSAATRAAPFAPPSVRPKPSSFSCPPTRQTSIRSNRPSPK